LLVGFSSSDDAAVYQIDDNRCLLSTVDFFPPVVPNARSFGRIAAANALSDVYAMGGKPLYALNIVAFPREADKQLLQEILAGGAEKCAEAGAILAGGHSIYDDGVKFGLAVTGIADIDKFYRNNSPRIGDKLILTKALGVGIITSAYRDDEADDEDVTLAINSMERLNKYAAEKLSTFDVSACTDITGFGLVGHLLEMTTGDSNNISAELYCDRIPILGNVRKYIDDDYITGGGTRNRKYAGNRVDLEKLETWKQELVFDPQTSGGLLIAVASKQADELLTAIQEDDPVASIIGCITQKNTSEVLFT